AELYLVRRPAQPVEQDGVLIRLDALRGGVRRSLFFEEGGKVDHLCPQFALSPARGRLPGGVGSRRQATRWSMLIRRLRRGRPPRVSRVIYATVPILQCGLWPPIVAPLGRDANHAQTFGFCLRNRLISGG